MHRSGLIIHHSRRLSACAPNFGTEPPIPIPETRSALHLHAQRNAFRSHARQQSRSFALQDQLLRTQPNLQPALLRLSATTLSTSARRIPSLRQRVPESNPIPLHTKFRGRCLFAAYFLGAGTGKSVQRAASLNFPGFLKLDKSDKQLL